MEHLLRLRFRVTMFPLHVLFRSKVNDYRSRTNRLRQGPLWHRATLCKSRAANGDGNAAEVRVGRLAATYAVSSGRSRLNNRQSVGSPPRQTTFTCTKKGRHYACSVHPSRYLLPNHLATHVRAPCAWRCSPPQPRAVHRGRSVCDLNAAFRSACADAPLSDQTAKQLTSYQDLVERLLQHVDTSGLSVAQCARQREQLSHCAAFVDEVLADGRCADRDLPIFCRSSRVAFTRNTLQAAQVRVEGYH